MKKKTVRILLIVAVVFACWLQFPVGAHVRKAVPGTAATCTETGLTEGKICILCGKTLTAQQVIPATGLHIYDNDYDVSCNYCSDIREVNCKIDFVEYCVTLTDENEDHKNWRAVVYKLGDRTVEDPTDEEALQAIDSAAKTHWGMNAINRIMLTDAGNYVVLLKYNMNVGKAAVKVPMVLTVDDDPKLLVDKDNRLIVYGKDPADSEHTLTAYYMGDVEIADPKDEPAVQNAALSTAVYTGLTEINETTITQGGNYVFCLRYIAADGTEKTVITAEKLEARPGLRIDKENKLFAFCDDKTLTNFRVVSYYVGDQTVTDIYNAQALEKIDAEPVAYWGFSKINEAVLKEPGTYVLHLNYNTETGEKKTVALKVTI